MAQLPHPIEQQDGSAESPVRDDAVVAGMVDQVLVEEVSIDGMCGVY